MIDSIGWKLHLITHWITHINKIKKRPYKIAFYNLMKVTSINSKKLTQNLPHSPPYLHMLKRSQQKGNEYLPILWIVLKLALIPGVVWVASAREVQASKKGKCKRLQRPTSDCPPCPLNSLSPQVSCWHILIHVPMWYFVPSFTGSPQVAQDRVALDVCSHAKEEDAEAKNEVPLPHPLVSVIGVLDEVTCLW